MVMPAPPTLSQPLGAAAGPAWAQGWDEGTPWMRVPRRGRSLGAEPRHHRPVSTASRLAGDPGDLGRGCPRCPRTTPVPSSAPAAAPALGAEPPGAACGRFPGWLWCLLLHDLWDTDVPGGLTGLGVPTGAGLQGGAGLPVTPRCRRGPHHAGTGTPVSPGAHGLVHGCVTWPAVCGPARSPTRHGDPWAHTGGGRAFRAILALAVALLGPGAHGAGGCVLQRCRAAGSLCDTSPRCLLVRGGAVGSGSGPRRAL